MLLPIHIAAGALAVIFGFVALSVKKGGTIHRRIGMLFVYAMLVMGTTASILEFLKSARATKCGRRADGRLLRRPDARSADRAALRRDVLLAMEGPAAAGITA